MTSSTEPPSPRYLQGRRVPDFFIVGHHKSGTTALYEMLRRHPQIFMSSIKEPRFLAADLRALVPAGRDSRLPETLDAYLALFDQARDQERVGEASPSYLRSQTAAGAIAELQPQARIIAILREPAAFVRSMHLQMLQEHVESEPDLGRAIAAEEIERQGQRVRRYADHVHYVEQLRRYHDVFGRDQVLVLIYDDFRSDNEGTVRRVLGFLGVDDGAPIEVLDANPTVQVRSMRLDSALRTLSRSRNPAVRALRRKLGGHVEGGTLQALRRRLTYGEAQPVEEDVMLELRRRYKDEVLALSAYLDRDLTGLWGYRDID
jgi:hypothetical protein